MKLIYVYNANLQEVYGSKQLCDIFRNQLQHGDRNDHKLKRVPGASTTSVTFQVRLNLTNNYQNLTSSTFPRLTQNYMKNYLNGTKRNKKKQRNKSPISFQHLK